MSYCRLLLLLFLLVTDDDFSVVCLHTFFRGVIRYWVRRCCSPINGSIFFLCALEEFSLF